LAKCQSSSEAQVDLNMKKPECKNALKADSMHQLGMKPE